MTSQAQDYDVTEALDMISRAMTSRELLNYEDGVSKIWHQKEKGIKFK